MKTKDLERTAPKSGLMRTYEFTRDEVGGDGDDDTVTMAGYVAVFDSPTRINSWEGDFDEQIDRKAFDRTLAERNPVIQFDHGRHPLIGSLPVGRLDEAKVDERGLYQRSTFIDTWLTEPLIEAIRADTIGGQSFRFDVVKDKWDFSGDRPMRTLLDIDVPEFGPVVFPAYEDTDIAIRAQQASDQQIAEAIHRLSELSADPRARTDKPAPKAGALTAAERLRWGQFHKENNA